MSNRKLRSEKNCLNCGRYVEVRYCSNCGQENTINRPSFYYLFTTFFRDLVNYDSNFWQTISILFFKPGSVVNQYLAGKRSSFVSPIKLYFFISLFTFLLPYNLINYNDVDYIDATSDEFKDYPSGYSKKSIEDKVLDSIQESTFINIEKNSNVDESKKDEFIDKRTLKIDGYERYSNANTRREFDSIHNSLPTEKKMSWMVKPLYRKVIELNERNVTLDGQFQEVFINSFKRNFPRVLILYLPVFAFVLWIFHSKKKWKYYDHGVFTLYYFSFLLLLISIIVLFQWLIFIIQKWATNASSLISSIESIIFSVGFIYAFFYFFRSHRKIYKESKVISRFKSFFIFGINFFLFTFSLVMYTVITFLMM